MTILHSRLPLRIAKFANYNNYLYNKNTTLILIECIKRYGKNMLTEALDVKLFNKKITSNSTHKYKITM